MERTGGGQRRRAGKVRSVLLVMIGLRCGGFEVGWI